MYNFIVFCVLGTASAATVSLTIPVPDNGIGVQKEPRIKLYRNGDSYYYFETSLTGNYFQATQLCNSLNMKLLSIETLEENNFVFETLRNIVHDDLYKFWTSGTRLSTSQWVWLSTGENYSFRSWKKNEPNDHGDEKCMEIIFDPVNYEKIVWNDRQCNNLLFPICESLKNVSSISKSCIV